MKILVVLACSLTSLAWGSLEPAGYKSPGTYPETRYLLPSSGNQRPDNRYISPSDAVTRQNVHTFTNQLSRSLSLPFQSEPVPFSHYLPANRQTSDENDYQTVIRQGSYKVLPSYDPVSVIRPSIDQAPPRNRYVSASENPGYGVQDNFRESYGSAAERSSSSSTGGTGFYSSNVMASNDIPFNDQKLSTNSNYREARTYESEGYQAPANYGHDGRRSGSFGHGYRSLNDQAPAKYDFEYEVKDNNGNDYGHKEIRNGENTQGVYSVLLPDGRRQIVHYEADSHGYRPVITYEEADASTKTQEPSTYNGQRYRY